jgi:hypothetical protein
MAKYKVILGTHSEGGRRYKAGEIVESDEQLDKMFINKFEKVEDSKKASPGVSEKSTAALRSEPKPTTTDTGTPATESDAANEKSTMPQGKDTAGAEDSDVTKDFAKADEAGFTVHTVEGGYEVRDDGKVISGKKPITSKTKVNEFVKEYLA